MGCGDSLPLGDVDLETAKACGEIMKIMGGLKGKKENVEKAYKKYKSAGDDQKEKLDKERWAAIEVYVKSFEELVEKVNKLRADKGYDDEWFYEKIGASDEAKELVKKILEYKSDPDLKKRAENSGLGEYVD